MTVPSHVQFTRARWKNFLSTGNDWIEVDLAAVPMTILVGLNGAGKSTLLDVIFYACFNRPFRATSKPLLVNTITRRDMVCEVELVAAGVPYKIVRGQKPAVFEIWRDGVLVDQDAKSSDYQDHLESSILRMTHKSCSQIVGLGSAVFVPFMRLNAGQRREVIENFLDLGIFSTMGQLLRERVTRNRDAIVDAERGLERAEAALQSYLSSTETATAERMSVLAGLESSCDSLEAERDGLLARVDELRGSIRDKDRLTAHMVRLVKYTADYQVKADRCRNDIHFFGTTDTCPTCSQTIDGEHRHAAEAARTVDLEKLLDPLARLAAETDKTNSRLWEIEAVEREVAGLLSRVGELNVEIRLLISRIGDLGDADQLARMDGGSGEAVLRATCDSAVSDLDALYREREVIAAAQAVLKDSGIKARIIKKYIPVFNRVCNRYLADLDFSVDFHLDENFNETIRSRHRDEFQYGSFSEGQKLLIDLAIMLSWRHVAKTRTTSSTNLLIMDEILDRSLDAQAVDNFMRLLRDDLSKDSNVFIISHRGDTMLDKFDRVLHYELVRNFTKMEVR
jgi:DNA repair exonuclease SbcCD ATPase subunit